MGPNPAVNDQLGEYGLIITCEHGGNRIPKPYQIYFDGYRALLDTHRGFDPGALIMAKTLAKAFSAPLVASSVSRLLVDLNRSVGHPNLHFSSIQNAPAKVRQQIVRHYYQPYRTQVDRLVRQSLVDHRQVIHLASHSFTPELDGQRRNADIGLLYDPSRPGEAAFCEHWKSAFSTCAPELKVRRNYPYAGKADGQTRWFRRQLPADAYLGIELEINQKHILTAGPHWPALRRQIVASLHQALANYSAHPGVLP
jgi:predicted N-formylglutamate amidohydrolase